MTIGTREAPLDTDIKAHMKKATHLLVLCLLSAPSIAVAQDEAPSCATAAGHSLEDSDLQRLTQYVIDRVEKADGLPTFELGEIQKAIGLAIDPAEAKAVKAAVMTRLKAHPVIIAKLSGSRCARYDACSLNRNLSGATGDELAMYQREKKEDGAKYTDRALPRFFAKTLSGRTVKSESIRGKNTLVAFLAGHCSHSHDSLKILENLERTYAKKGLEVVGVFVNSGTVEDVNAWIAEQRPTYQVWVHTDAALGDRIESHLVPTFFLVDAEGKVTEKLVGYKKPDLVEKKVRELLDCCHG